MFSDNFVLTEKTKTKTKTGVRPYEKKAPGISFFPLVGIPKNNILKIRVNLEADWL